MSHEADYYYELEQKRRRQLYLQRIAINVEQYYNRYREMQKNLVRYKDYIPDEFNRLESDLNSIQSALASGAVEYAQDISFSVNAYIYGIQSLGREAERVYQEQIELQRERERAEREERRNASLRYYYQIVGSIKDPLMIQTVRTDLDKIKTDITEGRVTGKSEIKELIYGKLKQAIPKVKEWKEKTLIAKASEIHRERLNDQITDVQNTKFENSEEKEKLLKTLQEIKNDVNNNNVSNKQLQERLTNVQKDVNEKLVTEDVRREAVKSVVTELRGQGFSVATPKLKDGFVYIVATKPSGKKAQCRIGLDGKFRYRFDHYEGQTCLKDIEQFHVDLGKIYSVKLSDERVIWQNPDRLEKDAMDNKDVLRRNL